MIYKKGTLVVIIIGTSSYMAGGVVVDFRPNLGYYEVQTSLDGDVLYVRPDLITYTYPADMFDNEKEALTWWLTSIKLNGDPYLTYDRGILSPSVVLNNLPGVSENIRINH